MSTASPHNSPTDRPSPRPSAVSQGGAGGRTPFPAVIRLPPGLAAHVEHAIARQQELNTELAAMERYPHVLHTSEAWQRKWTLLLTELAGVGDLLDLLSHPTVRFIALEQQRARRN